jgi:small subunit ribosomal protein S13
MATRIAGVTIPNEKRVEIALTYIYGIGKTKSQAILKLAKVNPDTRVKDLKDEHANKLREIIEKQNKVEGDLKRDVFANIKRLKEIGSYRGLRHAKGLPVRGQRTKTNSRTVRGNVRKTATSGKKPAAQKT